jgi:methionyl-tRNA synthetase
MVDLMHASTLHAFPDATPAKTFLLIPAMPTPNGRFHLGHIGGPLLKLDVMARLLRTRGHTAHLMMATDIYEAHVPLQAEKEGRSSTSVINDNCVLMQQDLLAFNIEYDVWFNPLQQPARALYERHNLGFLQRLLDNGEVRYVQRAMPFSRELQRYVARSLVAGACPSCGSGASGGVCEACGSQFSSHELHNAYMMRNDGSRAPDGDLDWREQPILEFAFAPDDPRLATLIDLINESGAANCYREIALKDAMNLRARSELTTPGVWGIAWDVPSEHPHIIYNYCTIYPYMLALGELYGQFSGTARNAFELDSDIVSIFSFGTDVTVCGITYPKAFALVDTDSEQRPRYKTFDHYWGNAFLLLEGSKFSTSRRHVIWASELIEKTPVSADAARYYLALIDPREAQATFTLDGLLGTINDIVSAQIIAGAHELATECFELSAKPPSAVLRAALWDTFCRQEACMARDNLDLCAFASSIRDWFDRLAEGIAPTVQDRYWFIKGLAVLAYPLMPDFASRLWRSLGHAGEPSLVAFWALTVPGKPMFGVPAILRIEDLYPCLPETLRVREGCQ